MSENQQTCGKRLAANAALPTKLGALMQAMSALLENHTRSLPRGDTNAERERDVQKQAREYRAMFGAMAGT